MKHSNSNTLVWIPALLALFILFPGCFSSDKTASVPPVATTVSVETPVDGLIMRPSLLKEELEVTGNTGSKPTSGYRK